MKYKKCNIIDIHIHDGQYPINILSTVVYFFKIVSYCGICEGAVANLLGFISEVLFLRHSPRNRETWWTYTKLWTSVTVDPTRVPLKL